MARTFVSFDVVAPTCVFSALLRLEVRCATLPISTDKIIKLMLMGTASFVALVDPHDKPKCTMISILNILRPDMEPRATHHIPEIIEITEQLIARGHAYVADKGM